MLVVGSSVNWLPVGWLFGWQAGWLVGQLADWFCLICSLASDLAGWLVGPVNDGFEFVASDSQPTPTPTTDPIPIHRPKAQTAW